MEARLTTVEGVEVLNRAEIDRVLAEQRLSLQGDVAVEQAVRAGRLLNCDLLVVIEQTPDLVKPVGRDASRGNDPAAPSGIRQRVPQPRNGLPHNLLESETPRRLISINDRGVIGTNGPLIGDHVLLQGVGWTIDFNARTDVALGISNDKRADANPMPLTVRTDIIPYLPAASLADAYWWVTDFGTGPGEVRFNGTATFSRVRFGSPPQRSADSATNATTSPDIATDISSTPRATSLSRLKEERIRIAVDPLPAKAKREVWLLEPFGQDRLL